MLELLLTREPPWSVLCVGPGYSHARMVSGGPKLLKAANPWSKAKLIQSDLDKLRLQVNASLNKLAWDKFKPITEKLVASLQDFVRANPGSWGAVMKTATNLIFDKSLAESNYSPMYAELCVELAKAIEDPEQAQPQAATAAGATAASSTAGAGGAGAGAGTEPAAAAAAPATAPQAQKSSHKEFRRILLDRCQHEFQRERPTIDSASSAADPSASASGGSGGGDDGSAARKQKQRMLGNIRFIGELYKKNMILERTMHSCVEHLLCKRWGPNDTGTLPGAGAGVEPGDADAENSRYVARCGHAVACGCMVLFLLLFFFPRFLRRT